MSAEPLDNSRIVQNTAVIANMIEASVEALLKISPDLIEVGNSPEAREEMAEAAGAAIFSSLLKEIGV